MMAYRRIVTGDANLDRVQDATAEVVGPLVTNPILDGVLVEAKAIATTATAVNHGLGRVARGFIIAKSNANATVWLSTTASPDTLNTLMLIASAAVTISVWIF